MLTSKSFAVGYLLALKTRMLFNTGTAGIKLCVGDIPTDVELEGLTQSSSRITNNVAVTIDTTGLTTMLMNASWPPEYLMKTPPTVPKGVSTKSGTISWAVLYNPVDANVVLCDVTLPNQGGVIETDVVNVDVGTNVYLMNISIKTGR
jgi:hypothetical protein